VGQKTEGGSDERVILFVKLVSEKVGLDEQLIKEIKLRIRTRRSARHVPERIIQVDDIPHTVNGKKVEIPIKKLINGATLQEITARTLRNPECLDQFVTLGELEQLFTFILCEPI
jgi:acetoacetyl-CoA synthetase